MKENKAGFSQRQYERALAARKLYHILGAPTIAAFKAMLKGNVIKNCPITHEDVNNAQKIFGPAISTLKGKSTRMTPKPVINDEISIPPELIEKNRNIVLCIDTLFINGHPMLTSIDTTIRFRGLVPLSNRKSTEYVRGLQLLVKHYNKGGFVVKRINCDMEFKTIMDVVKEKMNIDINYACLLYTSPSPRDGATSRMPSSA